MFKKTDEVTIPFSTAFSIDSVITPQNCETFGEGSGSATGLLYMDADFFNAPVREISIHHELLIVSAVKCLGPWDICIEGSKFVEYPEGADVVAVTPEGKGGDFVVVRSGESFNYVHRVKLRRRLDEIEEVNLGSLELKWKRDSTDAVVGTSIVKVGLPYLLYSDPLMVSIGISLFNS